MTYLVDVPEYADFAPAAPRCLPRLPHKAEMAARRARQLARVPGFTPVIGDRQAKAINAATDRLKEAWPDMDPHKLVEMAVREVARGYPVPKFERRLRAPRPSKSDDLFYRRPDLRPKAEIAE